MGRFRRRGQFPTSWGFLGWDERDGRQANPLKALIVLQATAGWHRLAGPFGKRLISGFPCGGLAQEAHVPGRRDHAEVCERGPRLLATGGGLWLVGIDRAVNRTFGTIRPTRGGMALLSVSHLAATSAAVRAGSRAGWAHACFNTGCRRGIHWFACAWLIPTSCPCTACMGCCVTSLSMKRRVSAIVGQGPWSSARSRRRGRGGPSIVRSCMEVTKACSTGGRQA
jgi:hypothetical protein